MAEKYLRAGARPAHRASPPTSAIPRSWTAALDAHGITAVVHGATVTPISRGSDREAKRQPEAEIPAGIVDVNLMGTVRMLEWARGRPGVKRFVYVSSGSVYRHHGPDWSGEPLPEDGYVAPLTLYGISKFAAEMVVNRYADLFGLSAISVRLSSVYGPMDRVTGSRNFRHVPNRVAHMALAGETIRPNSLEPLGDYVLSTDVARRSWRCSMRDTSALPPLQYRQRRHARRSAISSAGRAERVPGLKSRSQPARDGEHHPWTPR